MWQSYSIFTVMIPFLISHCVEVLKNKSVNTDGERDRKTE